MTVDESANTLHYAADIRSDESRSKTIGPEELVHALIMVLLHKVHKYPLSKIYHEKYIKHGSVGSKPKEIDILLLDEDDLPFGVWEIKSSSDYASKLESATEFQLFGAVPLLTEGSPRFIVCATIDPLGAVPSLRLRCIDYKQHKDYNTWKAGGAPTVPAFPVDYSDPDYTPYIRGGKRELRTNCTLAEFRAVATSFHNEFFSEHPDNQLFENLVKCLLAKISSEKNTKTGDEYAFQVTYKNGKPESAEKLFYKINELYKAAYKRYIDPNGEDEIDTRVFAPERVKSVVSSLEGMSITKGSALSADIMGAFFEEILRAGFKQDRGMYFTHDNIVRFMVEAVGLPDLTVNKWKTAAHPNERMPYVIDPACGSGTFLLHAMQSMSNAIRNNKSNLVTTDDEIDYFAYGLSDSSPNAWAKDFLYGFDYKFIMAMTAKVNMVLHGDGVTHIFKDDAFRPLSEYSAEKFRPIANDTRSVPADRYAHDVCETFDVVISNPPFGVSLSTETQARIPNTFSLGAGIPSEAYFIERAFQLLRPRGRLAVVLPESILNACESKATRMLLYRLFKIRAVVMMPRNIFVDTPTLTSLLFAQKKTAQEIDKWDSEWKQAEAGIQAQIKAARQVLTKDVTKSIGSAIEVQMQVLKHLEGIVKTEDWVIKSGANARVMNFILPESITTTEKAVDYYKDLFFSSGFTDLVEQSIFQKVSTKEDYTFFSYLVSEVGFKLSKRREKSRENQLCTFKGEKSKRTIQNLHLGEENVSVKIDRKKPRTVLDFIANDVKWELS